MERDIQKIISEMTLEEKAGMCSGKDFWHLKGLERFGIPEVMVSDGPHGIRKQPGAGDHLGLGESIEAVCFPAACATASSFNTDLMYEMGETLGEECQAEDLSVLLGPAINIKRSPLCGRNFEYMSEDPYLAGKMAAAYIRGVQSKDVGTSLKHFAANNQEYRRMSCSSDLSERTLREIYLPAFEIAVKEAQPKTIMCSYNKINGTYAAENHNLLTEILRDEWGFEGYVMTDWGAVADRVKGIAAGLELEMPGSGGYNDAKLVSAVKEGVLDEKILDTAVERILKVIFSYVDHRHPEAVFDRDADHQKAVKIETECAILLENSGVLPLKENARVVYIGEYAAKPRYQGGGSSHIHASRVTSAWGSAMDKGRNVSYVKGFPADRDETNEEEFAKAVQAAKESDVAVIFAGLPDSFESEGYDRKDMQLPVCQNSLIDAVAAVQPNTVVILHNGSPIEAPWAEKVSAILEMYLGGQGVGEATDQILFGEANPSGHLAETFPLRLEDNPSFLNFPGDGYNVNYAEGIYVGYRYYEKKKQPVRWAFGHGLSYTSFACRNLNIPEKELDDEGSITVYVEVENTGNIAGKEVVQLYVSDKNGTAGRPVKELKGFTKVELQPGEHKTVSFTLCARDLSFFHEGLHDWYAPSGVYEVAIGHASDEIALTGLINFNTKKQLPIIIDGSTTIGDLMKNPMTVPVANQVMQSFMGSFSESDQPSDGTDSAFGSGSEEMVKEMLDGMPLKSLGSFGGAEAAAAIESMILTLNQALGN